MLLRLYLLYMYIHIVQGLYCSPPAVDPLPGDAIWLFFFSFRTGTTPAAATQGAGMLQQITVVVKSLRHLPQQFFTEEKERELALSRHGHGHQRGHGHGHGHGHQQGRGGVDFRRCLRAQASIVNETRETGNSVWGRGVRSREATWLRGSDKLSWSLPEQQFKQVKAYTPVCKVRIEGGHCKDEGRREVRFRSGVLSW